MLTIYLLLIIAVLFYRIHTLKNKVRILDNNYNSCLMILKEQDPKLKEYLEK